MKAKNFGKSCCSKIHVIMFYMGKSQCLNNFLIQSNMLISAGAADIDTLLSVLFVSVFEMFFPTMFVFLLGK